MAASTTHVALNAFPGRPSLRPSLVPSETALTPPNSAPSTLLEDNVASTSTLWVNDSGDYDELPANEEKSEQTEQAKMAQVLQIDAYECEDVKESRLIDSMLKRSISGDTSPMHTSLQLNQLSMIAISYRAVPPFQLDLVIAVKQVSKIDNEDHGSESNSDVDTDEHEDDDNEFDEDEDEQAAAQFDEISDIHARLKSADIALDYKELYRTMRTMYETFTKIERGSVACEQRRYGEQCASVVCDDTGAFAPNRHRDVIRYACACA